MELSRLKVTTTATDNTGDTATATSSFETRFYEKGVECAVLFETRIEYEDGTFETVLSDDKLKVADGTVW
mgnify:CR=1 FL=1